MSTQVLTLAELCNDTSAQQNNREDSQHSFSKKELFSPVSRAHTNLHTVLRYLVTTLSLSQPLTEVLHTLADLIAQALEVDLCMVLLKEPSSDALTLAACVPDLQSSIVLMQSSQLSSSLSEKFVQSAQQSELSQLLEYELEALNPLKNVQYKTLLPVPLVVGTTCLGLFNCYSSQARRFDEDEQLMLCTIAGQTALMLKNRHRLEEDRHTQRMLIKAFFSDLLSAQPGREDLLRRRAYSLGFDLTQPHVFLQLECVEPLGTSHSSQQCEGLLQQIAQRIEQRYPALLVDEGSSALFCLICLDAQTTLAQVQSWFTEMVKQFGIEQQVNLSVGLSNPCTDLLDYHRAEAEASEALQIGAALATQGSCLSFNDLGAYRYLYQFARTDTLHDHYQEQIAALMAYDQRKKTNLLDTLEIYLESGGNAARTACLLDVHRNTLLQRLERIQKLSTLDLDQLTNRLPLLLALKVYRLRAHFAHSDALT